LAFINNDYLAATWIKNNLPDPNLQTGLQPDSYTKPDYGILANWELVIYMAIMSQTYACCTQSM